MCVMDSSRVALLDILWCIIQLFRYCDKMHSVRKPCTTSSARRLGSFQTLPPSLRSNFIFTSTQDPASEKCWFWAGRWRKPTRLGVPLSLLAVDPQTIHLCQSQASQESTLLPSPPLTPEALSHRHISAKWSLYTVLTGSSSISAGHAGQSGKQPIIFFFSVS